MTFETSVFPKRPSWPWSFNPVNVFAIFQNFKCPDPAVTKWSDIKFENLQTYTFWLWDLVLKTIFDFFQSQIVKLLSGSPACEHKYLPFWLKTKIKFILFFEWTNKFIDTGFTIDCFYIKTKNCYCLKFSTLKVVFGRYLANWMYLQYIKQEFSLLNLLMAKSILIFLSDSKI